MRNLLTLVCLLASLAAFSQAKIEQTQKIPVYKDSNLEIYVSIKDEDTLAIMNFRNMKYSTLNDRVFTSFTKAELKTFGETLVELTKDSYGEEATSQITSDVRITKLGKKYAIFAKSGFTAVNKKGAFEIKEAIFKSMGI